MDTLQIVEVDAKIWWKSRTICANLIALASLLVVVLGLIVDNAAGLGVDDKWKLWIGIGVGSLNAAVNLYLRPGTMTPLALHSGQHRSVVAHVPAPPPAAVPPRDFRH